MNYWGDKPLSVHNSRLDKLKGTHIPHGQTVAEYGKPHNWSAPEFELQVSSGDFLEEKLWFEASRVPHEHGLSKMINALPPKLQLDLAKLPAPTGWQSKINFLKQLR